MYGMINNAIEQLITEKFGRQTWEAVRQKANVEQPTFVSMQPYHDSVTYALVGAASELLQIPVPDLLEKFGEYWILFTANEGYGDLMKLGGDNLPEFLKNLNMLHFRIANVMPQLVPPVFDVQDSTNNSLTLLYKSKREGLSPMVIGLIKGLGIKFQTPCTVTPLPEDEKLPGVFKYTIKW